MKQTNLFTFFLKKTAHVVDLTRIHPSTYVKRDFKTRRLLYGHDGAVLCGVLRSLGGVGVWMTCEDGADQ